MTIGNHNKIMLAALFLSVSAHASLFYIIRPPASHEAWVKPGQIQVSVVSSGSKQPDTRQSKNIKSGTKSIETKLTDVASKDSRNMLDADNYQEKMDINNTDRASIQNSATNKLTVQLRGKIKTALQKHLTYPPIARRHGWQGTVTIHITVKGNGELQQVKLGKSSGYTLLDNSAIAALQKVGRIDELKPLLQGRTIPIELPIKYILEDFEYDASSV